RRAHRRRRSAEPQRDLRQPRGPQGTWQSAPLHDALHGGGRAPGRPGRRHRSRRRDRRRYTRRSADARRGARRWTGNARIGVPRVDGSRAARLMGTALRAMIDKDLRLFFSDRRAVLMSFAVPIAIASFFGSIFSGPSEGPPRIAVALVDEDGSAISRG